ASYALPFSAIDSRQASPSDGGSKEDGGGGFCGGGASSNAEPPKKRKRLFFFGASEAAAAAWAAGLSGAAVWGFLAFVLNYIPTLGSILAVALPVALEGRVLPGAALFGLVGAAFAVIAGRAALDGRLRAQAAASIPAALAIYMGVLQFGLPGLQTAFASPRVVALAEPWRACAEGPLVSLGYREPSLVFLAGTETRLATPEEAAEALAVSPGTLLLLERRWADRLAEARGPDAPALLPRGEARYFNYNRGKPETATLLTVDDPRWAPCTP
ncbi:MAG: hypothetical protein AAFV49_05795, partial [Pseudomonadota bacterium]